MPKKYIQCWRCAELFELPYRRGGEIVVLDEHVDCPKCGKPGFLPKELPFEIPEIAVSEVLLERAMELVEETRNSHDLRYLDWEGDLAFLGPMIEWTLDFYQDFRHRGKKDMVVKAILYLTRDAKEGKAIVDRAKLTKYFLNR